MNRRTALGVFGAMLLPVGIGVAAPKQTPKRSPVLQGIRTFQREVEASLQRMKPHLHGYRTEYLPDGIRVTLEARGATCRWYAREVDSWVDTGLDIGDGEYSAGLLSPDSDWLTTLRMGWAELEHHVVMLSAIRGVLLSFKEETLAKLGEKGFDYVWEGDAQSFHLRAGPEDSPMGHMWAQVEGSKMMYGSVYGDAKNSGWFRTWGSNAPEVLAEHLRDGLDWLMSHSSLGVVG